MTGYDLIFGLAGIVAAGSAVLAVTTRQVLHSALWLVVSLSAVSGCYLVLGAELVALVQLLVYVGAVVVLVLFALMLTRSPIGTSAGLSIPRSSKVAAFAVSAATAGLVGATLVDAAAGRVVAVRSAGTPRLAEQLFGTWVWPFELLSVLLLVALVAGLALTRLTTTPERPEADPR